MHDTGSDPEDGMSVWGELRAGSLLGSKQYVERLRPLLRDKRFDPEFRKRERFAARPSLEELFAGVSNKTTRNEQIYKAIRLYRYTLSEGGDCVGLLYSTISMIAKREHDARRS